MVVQPQDAPRPLDSSSAERVWSFGAGLFLRSHCSASARAVVAQLRQPGTLFRVRSMTTISITAEASAAIDGAFPGDWRNEIRLDGKGGYLLTLPEGMIALLEAIRGAGESYSDTIIRISKGD
jgi:hypothetical protein